MTVNNNRQPAAVSGTTAVTPPTPTTVKPATTQYQSHTTNLPPATGTVNDNGHAGQPAANGNPPKPQPQQGPKKPVNKKKPKPNNPDNKPNNPDNRP
jgi:hypothetical protein